MYTYQTTIRLHHTDAAGVVFFSNLFVIAHDAYESFLESHLTLNTLLHHSHRTRRGGLFTTAYALGNTPRGTVPRTDGNLFFQFRVCYQKQQNGNGCPTQDYPRGTIER
jgi:hypothetical protein